VYRNLSTVGLPLSGRPSELIELALSFGFDGMDIDILDFCQQAEIYGVDHARRLMVSARLKASAIRLPVTLSGDEATFNAEMERLPKVLEMTAAAECSRALATLVAGSDEHAFKDCFELHRTRLETIGSLAAQHGIMIGLAIQPEAEFRAGLAHQFVHTYEGLIGLVASCHAAVGAVVDGWALHLTGETPAVIAQLPAGKLVEIRLSDAPADVPPADLIASQRLMPGETGVINSVEILQAAAAAGFEGPVTPCAARATLKGTGRERIVRRAGDQLEAIWRDAGLPIVPRWFVPAVIDEEQSEEPEETDTKAEGQSARAGESEPATAS
jgi:sugar phosphate isomerase/epimerase